jgi:hypothetical protein
MKPKSYGPTMLESIRLWLFGSSQLDRIEVAIYLLGKKMANDFTEVNAELEGIATVAQETKATLVALVELILNGPNDQAAINALRDRAREIKESLAAAEDTADDVLPAVEQPPVE